MRCASFIGLRARPHEHCPDEHRHDRPKNKLAHPLVLACPAFRCHPRAWPRLRPRAAADADSFHAKARRRKDREEKRCRCRGGDLHNPWILAPFAPSLCAFAPSRLCVKQKQPPHPHRRLPPPEPNRNYCNIGLRLIYPVGWKGNKSPRPLTRRREAE